ncbi:sugar transferase [Singulisphaera acidiphila]|uniref:Glycosyl transferase possibly involved in lipopolysaccharide synthesis n=1 Tax=Singulisphaera acidiphila (strain ATCC BAA-1392 / DSM 18658 / VKM B-2454 / MOB10) TaxID=886293 RepID=L0DJP5_SINAD|nr:sugar transferase [Singulisphaera acidiphila]AGA29477.1 glycosyl transferase possibly involved in lipopolysaccharide synthesis [Singulisphaera acidiphila DSM 18658]
MCKPSSVHPSVNAPLKRLIDLTASWLGLIVLAPLFVCVSLAIYLKLGRPVLFRQTRAGYRARPFTIYKFRTMANLRHADSESLSDAEPIMGLGRFLRQTSIDELPQLWNVIRGDLSLVGPRPQILRHLTLDNAEQAHRHEVRPGMTGWAQVNGRNAISWEEKFRRDSWYVDHWSHWLDMKIIMLTIITVIRCDGIEEKNLMAAVQEVNDQH